MIHDEMIDRILTQDETITARETELADLWSDQRGLLRDALDAGVGATRLAEALGISRQTLYKRAAKER